MTPVTITPDQSKTIEEICASIQAERKESKLRWEALVGAQIARRSAVSILNAKENTKEITCPF